MPINEVYKNPTVTKVIFQLIFPNFFSMESKIGDFQLKIMDKFPTSTLLIQNQFLLTNHSIGKIAASSVNDQKINAKKIWQFKTEEDDVTVNISIDSLDISSTKHKTYNNEASSIKFRDTISYVVEKFFEVIPLIRISKMGLRYTDECPLPQTLTKETFLEYYDSYINFSKIDDIQNVNEFGFSTVMKRRDFNVIYQERLLKEKGDKYKYTLDFDGQITNISAKDYLNKLDEIHEEISTCYENVIKEPVIKLMQS